MGKVGPAERGGPRVGAQCPVHGGDTRKLYARPKTLYKFCDESNLSVQSFAFRTKQPVTLAIETALKSPLGELGGEADCSEQIRPDASPMDTTGAESLGEVQPGSVWRQTERELRVHLGPEGAHCPWMGITVARGVLRR